MYGKSLLKRINSARKILTCYDFTATPFPPTGKKNQEEKSKDQGGEDKSAQGQGAKDGSTDKKEEPACRPALP